MEEWKSGKIGEEASAPKETDLKALSAVTILAFSFIRLNFVMSSFAMHLHVLCVNDGLSLDLLRGCHSHRSSPFCGPCSGLQDCS